MSLLREGSNVGRAVSDSHPSSVTVFCSVQAVFFSVLRDVFPHHNTRQNDDADNKTSSRFNMVLPVW